MSQLVLDASVAMTWCYPDESSDLAYRVLDALEHIRAIVPSLWAVEIANALVVGERRQRLTDADRARFLELLKGLPIETDSQTAIRAMHESMQLALLYGLSVYDATYLELSMREGLMLATLDDKLRNAAIAAGVKTFL